MRLRIFSSLAPLFLLLSGGLLSGGVFAGQLDLGADYQTWSANSSTPWNGSEFLVPLTLSLDLAKDFNLYAQSEFAAGQYTDSVNGIQNLSDISDTVVGGKIGFKSFSLPSFVDVGVNIPTGNQSWETNTQLANIPAEFVDYSYVAKGFGLSGIYGVALPDGATQYGIGVGYYYTGALNPYANSVENLKLGDSIFLSLNRVTNFPSHQTQAITASAYYFLPTQEDSQNYLWMGPNFNLSYSWTNPSAFSFEAGVQYFLPVQTAVNGQWVAEPFNSLGARFYLNPSWAFGNLVLAGRVKYVLANGYGSGDPSYDGGGLLLGIEPSYKVVLDSLSALKLSASYDYITADGLGTDSLGNRVDVLFNRWTMGVTYELKL